MREHAGWDPVRDFAPITLAVSSPSVLVVHPSVPAKSVEELIALAKAKPGELNYGSAQPGSSSHIAAELLKSMAQVNLVRIPYKGNGPAFNALLAGQVQVMFAPAGSVAPHLNTGRLRALAVTNPKPTPLVPGLPTVAAVLPGFESRILTGLFVPAKTPAVLINRLYDEVVRVLQTPEVKDPLFKSGVEVYASSPRESAIVLKAEMARWGKVIKEANIHDE